ncbi:MAG: GatB/YqeY domain-containing protein [Candidatus Binatia bacterium]
MTVRERLNEDLKAAMREKAALRLSTIRMMRAEILNKDKEHGKEATEEEILRVLQSMLKKREEAAEQFAKGGRAELAAQEREEIRIIQGYLPAQIGDEELRRAAQAAIAGTGASSMKDMGKVMGLLTKQLGGQATPSRISQVVKELLQKTGI